MIKLAVSTTSGGAELDMAKMPEYYPFKSVKAQEQYLNYYDKRAREWPVASESRIVETSYGKTFIRISGSITASSLVLLPSISATSLIWQPSGDIFANLAMEC